MAAYLQVLRELEGVRGLFLFNSRGRVLAHQSHAIYDKSLLEKVSRILVMALDSLLIRRMGWDVFTVHFTDGQLLLKNTREYIIAVIADNTLNLNFADVVGTLSTQTPVRSSRKKAMLPIQPQPHANRMELIRG